jgi:hypothetical protein
MLIIMNLNVRCIEINIVYNGFCRHGREVVVLVWAWSSSWIISIGKCNSNPTKWAFWSWRCVVRRCPSTNWDETRPLPCQSCIHPHNLGVWFHRWQRKSRWWTMLIFLQKTHHPPWQWFVTTMSR